MWASYGAGGLVSDVANVEVELGGHAVEQADIDELLRAGKNAIDKNGQVVLHAHPALYTIDRAQGVQQPIGLHANRLGVDIHVIAAEPSPLRNIDTVIRQAHLGVEGDRRLADRRRAGLPQRRGARARRRAGRNGRRGDQRLGPLSAACWSACARSRSARSDITNDIAAAFAVQRRDAERLKCFYGSAMTSPRDNHEIIEATQIGAEPGAEPMKIDPRPADDGHPPARRGTDQ